MRKRGFQILLILSACVALTLVMAYVFRTELATSLATLALEHTDKVHCTKPQLTIARALDQITLGEIECTVKSGPIRYAHVEGTNIIELDGFSLGAIKLDQVTLDHRDRDVSHVSSDTMGKIASVTGLSDMLFKGMLDFRDLYAPDSPPVTMSKLIVNRAGKREAVLLDVEKTSEVAWDRCQARDVKAPGIDQIVTIRNLDLRVMPMRGTLNAGVYLSQPERGEKPDIPVDVRGERLDGRQPKFRFVM